MRWPWQKRSTISLQEYLSYFTFNGSTYGYGSGYSQSLQGEREEIAASFSGYAEAFLCNPVVHACMDVRKSLFSEARFQFRAVQRENGRPGDMFGTTSLVPLEKPWTGATTADLLTRMIQDVDLAGNFYGVRQRNGIMRLRPDWVSILLGQPPGRDLGPVKAGYAYWPGGKQAGSEPVPLRLEEVCHFVDRPDPLATYRGMSWISACLREILSDNAATAHKTKFWEHGATSNLMLKMDPGISREAFDAFVANFREQHDGWQNAYKTMFLAGGADPVVIGADFQQADFKAVQGAGETRIAAVAGVPPVIAGLSEGLEAATYSNYAQSIRRFADITMRPLWRNAAGSLAQIIETPSGSELWYDDRDIPALAEDQKDLAEIQQGKAATIKSLIDAGFEPDSVVSAVEADDFSRLSHTGLVSVQLLEPGAKTEEPGTTNGSVPDEEALAALPQ